MTGCTTSGMTGGITGGITGVESELTDAQNKIWRTNGNGIR